MGLESKFVGLCEAVILTGVSFQHFFVLNEKKNTLNDAAFFYCRAIAGMPTFFCLTSANKSLLGLSKRNTMFDSLIDII